eukprot:gene16712-19866_t
MSSTSQTTHVYDKTRTGPYPPRRQSGMTFNETFRALFPAILAVLLSLIVLSAFNHMDSSVVTWMNHKGINFPGLSTFRQHIPSDPYSAESLIKLSEPKQQQLMNPPVKRPLNWAEYEKLGPLTKGSYWEMKGRAEEEKERQLAAKEGRPWTPKSINKQANVFDHKKYEALGAKTSASYWQTKARMEEERLRQL